MPPCSQAPIPLTRRARIGHNQQRLFSPLLHHLKSLDFEEQQAESFNGGSEFVCSVPGKGEEQKRGSTMTHAQDGSIAARFIHALARVTLGLLVCTGLLNPVYAQTPPQSGNSVYISSPSGVPGVVLS